MENPRKREGALHNETAKPEAFFTEEQIALLLSSKDEIYPGNKRIAPDQDFYEFLSEGAALLKKYNPEFASL